MKIRTKLRWLYGIVTISSVIGFVASFMQMLEKITLLKNADSVLTCNINSVFSCSNILNATQSSVFGFPNSLLCISFFGLTLSVGLVGWTGGQITAKLRLFYQGLALFFVGFGFWYFWQSIFNVGSLCIFCIFCYGSVLAISGSWLRLNYTDMPISKNGRRITESLVSRGYDLLIWFVIAAVIFIEVFIKFR